MVLEKVVLAVVELVAVVINRLTQPSEPKPMKTKVFKLDSS